MDFWQALIRLGVVQGSAADLASGNVTGADYANVIQTAIRNTAVGSAERRFIVNMLFATGGFEGSPAWWINQRIADISPTDWNNLGNAAARQFTAQSQVAIPGNVAVPPGYGIETGGGYAPGPVTSEGPIAEPTPPTPPTIPDVPDVTPGDVPDIPPFDYAGAAQLIAPWLPNELVSVFADAWAEFGDPQLALSAVRQDSRYDSYFPGIKRPDGSLRMTEQEYYAQRDAYSILLLEYNVNPAIFEAKFTDLIAGDVSAGEFAQRLEAAFEGVVSNFDQVRQVYSQYYGIDMTDEAIFASFIDEDIGQAILDRRIAISQVGGAAALSGFGLSANYAERLVNAGLSQTSALNFFGRAANDVPTLQRLATRYNDPDASVDITEFTEAGVFQDPAQTARFRRLRAAETSAFTGQELARFTDTGAIEGLQQR